MDISQSLYNISENDDNFLDLILEMDVLTEELLTPRGFEANIFIRPLLWALKLCKMMMGLLVTQRIMSPKFSMNMWLRNEEGAIWLPQRERRMA